MFKKLDRYQKIAGIVLSVLFLVLAMYFVYSYKGTYSHTINNDAVQSTIQEDGSELLTLAGITLPASCTNISINYNSDCDAEYVVRMSTEGGVQTGTLPAAPDGSVANISVSMSSPVDNGRLTITHAPDSSFQLISLTFAADRHLYRDGLFWGAVCILMIAASWVCVILYGKSEHKKAFLAVIIMILLSYITYFVEKTLMFGIDTRGALMRVEGIAYGLRDHQFPVILYPEWNNSYGQIGILYPNMFLYIPAVLRIFNVSMLSTYKFFLLLLAVVEGVIAYNCAKVIFKKDWQIILTCMLIIFENRHLHNMYYSGKFAGEALAELFYPLIIVGIINIYYGKKDKWYLLGIGLAGLINCHIVGSFVTLMALVIISLFSITCFKKKETWIAIGKAFLLFLPLSIGMLVSFIRFYFSDWDNSKLQWISLVGDLCGLEKFFTDPRYWSSFLLIAMCIVIMAVSKVKKEKETLKGEFYAPLCLTALILFWMSTRLFPWALITKIPIVLFISNMIQTSDRFLSLASVICAFCLPACLGVCLENNKGISRNQSRRAKSVMAVCLVLTVFNIGFNAWKYINQGPLIFDEVCGEVYGGRVEDYLPTGTQSEWYETDAGYISDEQAVESLEYLRNGSHVDYTYTCSSEGVYAEFPKFYYVGYTASDESGQPVRIEKGDHNRIRVYLDKSDSPKEIHIMYKVAGYLTIAAAVSYIFWAVLCCVGLFNMLKGLFNE